MRISSLILSITILGLVACTAAEQLPDSMPGTIPAQYQPDAGVQPPYLVAIVAGGCFWCVEAGLEKVPGVIEAESGYTDGRVHEPTYKQVAGGVTGHTEAVRVTYDPRVLSYADVLQAFWAVHNPVDGGGQFADRGSQYRPGIYYLSEEQRRIAIASRDALASRKIFSEPIQAEIKQAGAFYPAESYHQDYYKKEPGHYFRYFHGSGRAAHIKKYEEAIMATDDKEYSKPEADEIKDSLNDLQYQVTQNDATERPFQNEFWNNKEAGIYLDVVSGEPLFASTDKFDSGTGWPSFSKALEPENVVEKKDTSHGMVRVEVRSKHGDSHLGHLFPDGPRPTGLRYCINSASLRFVPVAQLDAEGLGSYRHLFD